MATGEGLDDSSAKKEFLKNFSDRARKLIDTGLGADRLTIAEAATNFVTNPLEN